MEHTFHFIPKGLELAFSLRSSESTAGKHDRKIILQICHVMAPGRKFQHSGSNDSVHFSACSVGLEH